MDPRYCRGAVTPTVQQRPVDPQRTATDGAVPIIRSCGPHNPAEDEPHIDTGRCRRGGLPHFLGRPIVPPPGRATAADDTEQESNEDNATTSPCGREPVEQRRSSGTTPQGLPLRCRKPLRGIHLKKIRDARLTRQILNMVAHLARVGRPTNPAPWTQLGWSPRAGHDRRRLPGRSLPTQSRCAARCPTQAESGTNRGLATGRSHHDHQQPLWAPNEKEQRSDPRTTTPSRRSRANRSPEADPQPTHTPGPPPSGSFLAI